MKQHIAVKQLNELSEKGRERLREWWKPKEGDWTCWDGKEFCLGYIGYQKEYKGYFDLVGKGRTMDLAIIPELKVEIFDEEQKITDEFQAIRRLRLRGDLIGGEPLPLLDIGQMIEFLDDWADGDEKKVLEIARTPDYKENGKQKKGEWTINLLNKDGLWLGYDELCQGLWEAVKEVLEK